jgi:hypothetical protein
MFWQILQSNVGRHCPTSPYATPVSHAPASSLHQPAQHAKMESFISSRSQQAAAGELGLLVKFTWRPETEASPPARASKQLAKQMLRPDS